MVSEGRSSGRSISSAPRLKNYRTEFWLSTLILILYFLLLGRHNSDIHQPARPKPLSVLTRALSNLQTGRDQKRSFLLWYVLRPIFSRDLFFTWTPSIPDILNLFVGSSRGRGTRAGGWFADFVEAQGDGSGIQSLVLEGGIKGWVGAGQDYVSQVDGYDEAVWKKFEC
jgi:hypothetical protein